MRKTMSRVAARGLVITLFSCAVPAALGQESSTDSDRNQAREFFETKPYLYMFLAKEGGPFLKDPTGVSLINSNDKVYLLTSETNGCRSTFANENATFGTSVGGRGTITIDWSQVNEIDDSTADYDRGVIIHGGISNNFGTKPYLRVVGSYFGAGSEFVYFARMMQNACR